MMKKFLSIILMMLVMLGSVQSIYADETTVTMPALALNSNLSLDLSPEQTQVYPFTVANNGTVDINGAFTTTDDVYIRIYNSDMQQIRDDSSSDYATNAATGKMELSLPLQVTPGNYYLSIRNNSNDISYTNTINVKFNAIKNVKLPAKLSGYLLRNEVAVYKTTISKPTYFYLTGNYTDKTAQDFRILDANGNEIYNDNEYDWEHVKWSHDNKSGLDRLHLKTNTYQPGTYYIKVINKDKGNLTYSLNVSIKGNAKKTAVKLKTSKKSFTLKRKAKKTLKVSVSPKSLASKLTWKTSDKKVATISKKGTVVAKNKGKCFITASLNGKKIKFTIKVK